MTYKYGVSPVIAHPQGNYRVVYRTPERTLKNSVLLWFKTHDGRFIKDENEAWRAKELRRLRVKH